MSRNLFLPWGASLDDDAFAQAVAAAALVGVEPGLSPPPAWFALLERLRDPQTAFAGLSVGRLAAFIELLREPGGRFIQDASTYVTLWQMFLNEWSTRSGPYRPLRVEIDDAVHRNGVPDLLWLTRELARPGVGVASAYVRADQPDLAVTWDWPLRIGLLGDPRSQALKPVLAGARYAELYRVVDAEAAGVECDVLVLPFSLHGALSAVLGSPRRLRADCVILLGGLTVSAERALPLFAALRSEVETAGIAIDFTAADQRTAWFEQLIRQLAHDEPLDIALWQVARGTVPTAVLFQPPLVVASRRLMSGARLSEFALRFSARLKHAPEPPAAEGARTDEDETSHGLGPSTRAGTLRQAGEALERDLAGFGYAHEGDEATELARLRRSAEARLGEPLRVARIHAVRAPAPRREPDHRRLTAVVRDVTDPRTPPLEVDALRPDRAYEASIGIELPREDRVVADAAFPSNQLPESSAGHTLTVAFVPLNTDARGQRAEPQVGTVFLPPTGPSRRTSFSFDTRQMTGEFRARILVLHENRVLQTLTLSAPVAAAAGEITLKVENLVTQGFQNLEYRERFDAAIVANDSPTCVPGFTTITGQQVSFLEPVGIGKTIEQIKALISGEAALPEKRSALKNPELEQLLWKLASYGRGLLDAVPNAARDAFEKAGRLQVVEARTGAFLPVEFFYGGEAPDNGAKLCENAATALGDPKVHLSCPHRNDGERICPAHFWGFNRVIERQPTDLIAGGGEYAFSVPNPDRSRLDILRCALVAGSSRVRKQDLTGSSGVVAAIRKVAPKVATARDWDDWVAKVEKNSPSLLVLLPHSQDDPALPGMPALEIGDEFLRSVKVGQEHVVAKPASDPPAVLLLGCSTQLTDIPFLNFVQRFKAKRAALVVGTLATIRGRRTVGFVRELMSALESQTGAGERTFGDAFLEVKRRLLAQGDSFVLSLVAYGDAGWRL